MGGVTILSIFAGVGWGAWWLSDLNAQTKQTAAKIEQLENRLEQRLEQQLQRLERKIDDNQRKVDENHRWIVDRMIRQTAAFWADGTLVRITEAEIVLREDGVETSYRLDPQVKIELKGKPAKLADLKAGMDVRVHLDFGRAVRIEAYPPGKRPPPFPEPVPVKPVASPAKLADGSVRFTGGGFDRYPEDQRQRRADQERGQGQAPGGAGRAGAGESQQAQEGRGGSDREAPPPKEQHAGASQGEDAAD
jgi:hypothetical protein